MTGYLTYEVARTRIQEMHRAADEARRVPRGQPTGRAQRWPAPMSGTTVTYGPTPVVIRLAHPGDDAALERLAQLEARARPAKPMLVAEVDGEVRAALSTSDGLAIADPFQRTLELVSLLRLRARQLRAEQPRGLRVLAKKTLDAARRALHLWPQGVAGGRAPQHEAAR